MKKYLLLLITTIGFSQVNPTAFNKIKVTGATKNNGATRVVVQDSITKEYHWKLASSLGTTGAVLTTTDQTINGTKTFVSDIYVNNSRIGGNSATANNMHGLGIGSSFTTATGNSLFGNRAGSYITTGSDNACFGTLAGYSTTVGNLNTYIGAYAGLNNITGSNNVFLGGNAGSLISDGVTNNTNTTSSILIGYNTKPLGNTQVNQIVIGDNASGLGSNTTTIGNSSTTFSNIRGRLLLGSTTDNGADNLQLTGSMNLATTPTTSASTYDILTRNTSTGKVEKILSTGLGDMTLGTAQTFTGTKSFSVASLSTPALNITNALAGGGSSYGVNIANSNDGSGININQTGSGQGIKVNNSSNGQGMLISANGTIEGLAIVVSGTCNGAKITNNNIGAGLQINNGSSGNGLFINNLAASTNTALLLNNQTGTTAKPFQYTKQGVEKAFINDAGDLSAQSVTVLGTLGLRNVANTFTSSFTNTNTAARTYTLPDRDMTVAGLSDIPFTISGNDISNSNTGNVGIGNPSPSYKLDVKGVATTGIERVVNVSSVAQYAGIVIDNNKAGGTGQSFFSFAKNGSLTFNFGSDYLANGTKDFFIFDQTRLKSPLYFSSTGDIRMGGDAALNTEKFTIKESTGNIGVGIISPTAKLNIAAGTATANTAPLKFTAGTNLTTTEAGTLEYNGTHLYFTATNGGTRYQLDQQNTVASVVRIAQYTVATLPTGTQGDNAYVTDALAPTFLATVVGGGSVVCPVFYNGTNWVAH